MKRLLLLASLTALLTCLASCSDEGDTVVNLPSDPTMAPVTSLAIVANGNTADLSWVNPTDSRFAGVMVRRHHSAFPVLPTDGDLVYSGTAETLADAGLDQSTYYYAVFTHDGAGHLSGPVVATVDITQALLSDVTGFTATGLDGGMTLAWTNPTETAFQGVMIRRSVFSAPASPDEGELAYQGSGQTHTEYGLAEDTTYYYTAFAYRSGPVLTSGAMTSATTLDTDCAMVGWIGGGSDGWKTGTAPSPGNTYRDFNSPSDGILTPDRHLLFADTGNHRVVKWDLSGNAVAWIGGGSDGWHTNSGSTSGQALQRFYYPRDVAVDAAGNLYVTDSLNNRVCKWNAQGQAVGWIGGGSDGWQTGTAPSIGSGPRNFFMPIGIAIDSAGNLYIVDHDNDRVCKWTVQGTFVGWIGGGADGWQIGTGASSGTDYRSFTQPFDVALDGAGNLYVTSRSGNRVSKWDASGTAVGWIGGGMEGWQTGSSSPSGTDLYSFNSPRSICVSESGDIFVTCPTRVCKWTAAGIPVGSIGNGTDGWSLGPVTSGGIGDRQFSVPEGLAVSETGAIYVGDSGNDRIVKWLD